VVLSLGRKTWWFRKSRVTVCACARIQLLQVGLQVGEVTALPVP